MKAIIKLIITAIGIFIFNQAYEKIQPEQKSIYLSEYESSSATIKEILDEPYLYKNPVTVFGKIGETVNIFGISYFKLVDLEDSNRKLLVIPTSRIVPKEGSELRIYGRVEQLIKVADLDWVILKAME